MMLKPIYSNPEISRRLARAQQIARRVATSRMDRARAACREAGLGDWNGCTVHNAMLAMEDGKPWPEVNYSALRRAVWLEQKSFEPSAIVDRFYRRICGLSQ